MVKMFMFMNFLYLIYRLQEFRIILQMMIFVELRILIVQHV